MQGNNHVEAKHPLKKQERSVDFNVTEYTKFSDEVSGCTLQLISKKFTVLSGRLQY